MSFYIIIRGPLGVGKSTVSKGLAKEIGGRRISIDRILDEHGLWETGRVSEFLQANRIAVRRAQRLLAKGTPVILEGNFYWKSVIEDLVRRLDRRHYVFTLAAPLSVCIQRDSARTHPHGRDGAKAVYAKSTKFDCGIPVDATGSVAEILDEIRGHLPRDTGSITHRRTSPA